MRWTYSVQQQLGNSPHLFLVYKLDHACDGCKNIVSFFCFLLFFFSSLFVCAKHGAKRVSVNVNASVYLFNNCFSCDAFDFIVRILLCHICDLVRSESSSNLFHSNFSLQTAEQLINQENINVTVLARCSSTTNPHQAQS